MLSLTLALGGCLGDFVQHGASPATHGAEPATQLERVLVPQRSGESSAAVQKAMDALVANRLADATQQLNLAIALDPRNPTLHFLNGVVYQLRAARGEKQYVDLAENGFVVALENSRDYAPAAVQLARLYYDERRYLQAQRAAALALQMDSESVDAVRLLAAASYYKGDPTIALWAIRRARELDPANAESRLLEPLIYGAAGLDSEATRSYETLVAQRPDVDRSGKMQRRLRQWREFYRTTAFTAENEPAPKTLAQFPPGIGPSTTPPAAAPTPSPEPPPWPPVAPSAESPAPRVTPPGAFPPPPPATEVPLAPTVTAPTQTPAAPFPPPPGVPAFAPAAAQPPQQGPMAPNWSDCGPSGSGGSGIGGSSFGGSSYGGSSSYGSSTTGDETAVLPPLPSPCYGRALPRMAMIDAVMLRTDDITTHARGVNLLDGLSIFVQNSLTSTKTYGPTTATTNTTTITQGLTLGTNAAGGIAYSLNIANASDQRADILARPTLLVLDRQPAQFFSGSSVSVALVSTQGGGNLQEKPVGVSLSVTPTFIDDETLLINVKAARSFFETTASTATFEQSVQTSRNVVQASVIMKFNQTLILSGLSEREIERTASGVPVLRDIPGLQYFFNRQTDTDFTKSVLILLTPRKVSSLNDAITAAENAERISREAEPDPEAVLNLRDTALKDLGGLWPNTVLALSHMEKSNRFFRAIRTGDIRLEEWPTSARLQRILNDAMSLIYH